MGAPSGDADAEADVEGAPASFDELLRRAAAARARHLDDSEPEQTGAVAAGEGDEAGASESEDQPL